MKSTSLDEINEKIKKGEASVFTAHELKERILEEDIPDVDVVTTGTCGVMSGTMAVFHFQALEPGTFKKAKNVYLNEVPAFNGPCPNEWLSSLDLVVFGTSKSVYDINYGGGFLFRDLLNNETIEVRIEDENRNFYKTEITLEDMKSAKILGTRMAFKNYTAFTNSSNEIASSIFNAIPMDGPFTSLSFSGCGDLNPLQNDPSLETIFPGNKILLNGSLGMILGTGTRSSTKKPNLMLTADMHDMNPEYLGGFKTASGAEIFNTLSVAIPVLNEKIFENLLVLNKDIPIQISDIRGRHLPISLTDYSSLWDDHDGRPHFNISNCLMCSFCEVENKCPTNAYKDQSIDLTKCFGCGICSKICLGDAFEMDLGSIDIEFKDEIHSVDVACRQSDRLRAKKLSEEFKDLILNKEFYF